MLCANPAELDSLKAEYRDVLSATARTASLSEGSSVDPVQTIAAGGRQAGCVRNLVPAGMDVG